VGDAAGPANEGLLLELARRRAVVARPASPHEPRLPGRPRPARPEPRSAHRQTCGLDDGARRCPPRATPSRAPRHLGPAGHPAPAPPGRPGGGTPGRAAPRAGPRGASRGSVARSAARRALSLDGVP
jgi:hypothetical protein